MSTKTILILTFHIGAVDGGIVVLLKSWTISLVVLYIVKMFLFFYRDSGYE